MDREVLKFIQSDSEWLSTQPWQTKNIVVARHALRCFSFVNDFIIHAYSNRFTEVMALKAARICIVLASNCTHSGPYKLTPQTTVFFAGGNSAAQAGMLARHPLGLAALQAIVTAHAAIPSQNFSEKIQHSLEISAELGDSVAAGFISDVELLRRSLPFSDGSSFSDGTEFAISNEELYSSELWKAAPIHIQHFAVPRQNTPWMFWGNWQRAFWEGKPLSSSLQSEVMNIGDSIWDAGPEAVAEEIERIRAEFDGQLSPLPRHPEHEPRSVNRLIENRMVAAATLDGMALQIRTAIERFHAETGANCLPDALQSIQTMPVLVSAISTTLRGLPSASSISSETEDQLRAEIGRLNARVAELEIQVASLKSELNKLSQADRDGIKHWLRNTAFWGTLVGGLWALSGDDKGLYKRYESLLIAKDELSMIAQDLVGQEVDLHPMIETPRPKMRP